MLYITSASNKFELILRLLEHTGVEGTKLHICKGVEKCHGIVRCIYFSALFSRKSCPAYQSLFPNSLCRTNPEYQTFRAGGVKEKYECAAHSFLMSDDAILKTVQWPITVANQNNSGVNASTASRQRANLRSGRILASLSYSPTKFAR